MEHIIALAYILCMHADKHMCDTILNDYYEMNTQHPKYCLNFRHLTVLSSSYFPLTQG